MKHFEETPIHNNTMSRELVKLMIKKGANVNAIDRVSYSGDDVKHLSPLLTLASGWSHSIVLGSRLWLCSESKLLVDERC